MWPALIISSSKVIAAIAAGITGTVIIARALWKSYQWCKGWAVRIERALVTNDATLQHLVQRADINASGIRDIKAIIGTNGGQTIFQQLEAHGQHLSEQDRDQAALKDAVSDLKTQAALNAKLAANRG